MRTETLHADAAHRGSVPEQMLAAAATAQAMAARQVRGPWVADDAGRVDYEERGDE